MSKVYVVVGIKEWGTIEIISVYQDERKAIEHTLKAQNWYRSTVVQPYDVDLKDHSDPVVYIVRDMYGIVGVYDTKEFAEKTNRLLLIKSRVEAWGIA